MEHNIYFLFPAFATTLRRNLGVETRPGAHAASGLSQTLSRVWKSITNWRVPKVSNPTSPVYLATRLDRRRPPTPAKRPRGRHPGPPRRTPSSGGYKRPVYKQSSFRRQFDALTTTTTTTTAPRVYYAQTEQTPSYRVDNNYSNDNNNNNYHHHNFDNYLSQGLSSSSSSWEKHTVQRQPSVVQKRTSRPIQSSLWRRLGQQQTTKSPSAPYYYYQAPKY